MLTIMNQTFLRMGTIREGKMSHCKLIFLSAAMQNQVFHSFTKHILEIIMINSLFMSTRMSYERDLMLLVGKNGTCLSLIVGSMAKITLRCFSPTNLIILVV